MDPVRHKAHTETRQYKHSVRYMTDETSFEQVGKLIAGIFQYISNKMQSYAVYFIWKLLYMFRVVLPPIIRSGNNCIYSIWYLSDKYQML